MFRNLVRSLSQAFQEGSAFPPIWLISFIWILIAMDQPITLGAIIAAGFMALLAMWLIGWLVGLSVVLLDGILEIADMRRDIRAASDTTDKPPRRPLP